MGVCGREEEWVTEGAREVRQRIRVFVNFRSNEEEL